MQGPEQRVISHPVSVISGLTCREAFKSQRCTIWSIIPCSSRYCWSENPPAGLANRLLNHAGAGKSNQALGSAKIRSPSMAESSDTSCCGIGQQEDVRLPGTLLERPERHTSWPSASAMGRLRIQPHRSRHDNGWYSALQRSYCR